MTLLLALVAVLGFQTPAPQSEPVRAFPEFSTVLPDAEWRLWMKEVAPRATPAGKGDESASQERLSGGRGAPEPSFVNDDAGPATTVGLPEYSCWTSGQRECWLATRTDIYLRRVAVVTYAGLAVADQGGWSVALGFSATERNGRLVFDRWVPWGPCREARVMAMHGGALKLVPVEPFALAVDSCRISVSSVALRCEPARADRKNPGLLDAHAWMEWTSRALRSALPGLAPDKAAVWKDGVFVFERADGLRWWVKDPRLNALGDDLVVSGQAADAQVRRIARREGRGDLTLPAPAHTAAEFDGEWVDAADPGHRLHLRGCGKGKLAVLELLVDSEDAWGRVARQLEGTLKDGRLGLKAGLMKSGARRLLASELDGEVVLVSDCAETLIGWNANSAERGRLGGVWRRVKGE